jgi:hypothetical protein
MREIKIISTQGDNNVSLQSAATTWSELQREVNAAGVSTSNMKAMVRETKATLEMADAQLPTGNFTLFLTASKVKSGL